MASEEEVASPMSNQWEFVEGSGDKMDSPRSAHSTGGARSEAGSVPEQKAEPEINNEKGMIIGQSQDFEKVHAKAVAQIELEQEAMQDLPPLPVSTDLCPSDTLLISSQGSLSGFSSGNSEFENVGNTRGASGSSHIPTGIIPIATEVKESVEKGMKTEPDSPEAVSALLELSQEGSLEGCFIDRKSKELDVKADDEGKLHSEAKGSDDCDPEDAVSNKMPINAPAWLTMWIDRWKVLLQEVFPKSVLDAIFGQFQASLSGMNWKSMSKSAAIVMLSAIVVGLFLRNRKLAFELKRKHEEVARLMVGLMNFQELWSANRSNAPVLRHASIVLHQ